LIVLWLSDVHSDLKHSITVISPTPLFAGEGESGGCSGHPLTTLETGTRLPVRRIHYLKDCATLDLRLPDGREGYVVLGLGDVRVDPPLEDR